MLPSMSLDDVEGILEDAEDQSCVMLAWAVNACRLKIAANEELHRAQELLKRLLALPRAQMAVDRFKSNPPPRRG